MAQWLAALVLAESPVEFPVPTWQLPTICKSRSGGVLLSSDLHGHQALRWHICCIHAHDRQTDTHIRQNTKI